MAEKQYQTDRGTITYWTDIRYPRGLSLIFLPGLTADHRLFDKQIEYFAGRCNVLVWDAPAHGASRPFPLDFTLSDMADWLHGIIAAEEIEHPILVGQSMGGYVAQCYMERYPGEVRGFAAIDSAPLQKKYYTEAELALLKRMEPIYRAYPWKLLIASGSKNCAETEYGRTLMRVMMESYDKTEYARLAGFGYLILAEAVEDDLPYRIDCPAVLICGEHDRAGSVKSYDRRWTAETHIPLHRIPNAGHNSNTDQPAKVNQVLEDFLAEVLRSFR